VIRGAAGLAAALWIAGAAPGWAQKPDLDPDSPEAHAKAREALPRAQRVELKPELRTVAGESRQIVGIRSGIEGRTHDVAGLLKDLNAEVRGQEVRIALAADVLFDFDKAELRAEAKPALDKVAAVLKAYPQASAKIEGHTDGKGDAAYNQKLSLRRAESVRAWLAANGVGMKIATRGWGKDKPVAPNTGPGGKDNPEGRQKNRRVEITMTREERKGP
jgi:outer membrane protein OmpA-like peptidoglycan-associated protein